MIYLIGLLLSVASFLLQTWPRFRNRLFGVDTWRHLVMADYYRRKRSDPAVVFDRYLIPEPSDYPPMLRWLLSLFPLRLLEKSQWLVSPIFDFTHSFMVFVVAYSFTENLWASIAAQAAYALAPIVVMANSSLTTRPLASLMFTGLMLTNLAFTATGEWAWLPASLLAGTLLFLTHRMALQALVVATVALSLFFLTPYYLLSALGSWLLAIVVSRGLYWQVFKGHLAMLNWWRGNIHNRFAHQIRGLPGKGEDSADPVFKIYQAIRKAPFVAVFSANAFVIFAIVAAINQVLSFAIAGPVAWQQEFEFLLVLSLSLMVAGILIRQIPALEFIGEGERYVEYGVFPVALIVAGLVSTASPGWGIVLAVSLVTVALLGGLAPALFIQYRVVARDVDRSVTPALLEIMTRLDSLDRPARLMTIPLALADSALQFSAAKVLSTDSSLGHLHHYDDFFPLLQVPITDIFDRWEIDHLLINENYVQPGELGLDETTVALRSGNFCLLKVDGRKDPNS